MLTTEFFKSIETCLATDGVAVLNAFLDEENMTPNRRLFATIAEAFPFLKVHYLSPSNAVIVAARRPLTGDGTARLDEIPDHLRDLIDNVLRAGRDISRENLAGIPPVVDDANVFSVLFAAAEMRLRGNLARLFPPHVLVN